MTHLKRLCTALGVASIALGAITALIYSQELLGLGRPEVTQFLMDATGIAIIGWLITSCTILGIKEASTDQEHLRQTATLLNASHARMEERLAEISNQVSGLSKAGHEREGLARQALSDLHQLRKDMDETYRYVIRDAMEALPGPRPMRPTGSRN